MTTPNLFALMGRLEELLQNEKRYLALRREQFNTRGVFLDGKNFPDRFDEYADKLIEEQGDIQDE